MGPRTGLDENRKMHYPFGSVALAPHLTPLSLLSPIPLAFWLDASMRASQRLGVRVLALNEDAIDKSLSFKVTERAQSGRVAV